MSETYNTNGIGLKPGEKIGRYEITTVLGIGGQSIVYKCYDPSLDRSVAIKQIASPLAADTGYREQLRKTIQTIAKLGANNDAIITIHEVIENDSGLFYVMEFVEGHTLETLIHEADGPIETKALLLILFRLAAALHDVHGAGIIHRDVKPSNIILTEGLRPKIIDFGVAALGDGDASMPLATTKYLAPEVYRGKNIDGRADIYSLGFITYEMALGREKFNEVFEDIVRDKHSEALRWMKWHGNEAVIAPPACEVLESVPVALSGVIARMIEKDPAKRFADTEELGRAIKTSFSPKARRGEAPAATKSSGTGKLSALSAEHGIGSLEGDELEYTPHVSEAAEKALSPALDDTAEVEGPATAPLPKLPMTKQKKITLIAAAAVVFVSFCVGAGILIHKHNLRQEELANSAKHIFTRANNSYKEEKYTDSLTELKKLRKQYPKTKYGLAAAVMIPMCQAHLAILKGNWNEAQLCELDAENAVATLQEKTEDTKVVEWSRVKREEIEQLKQYRYSSEVFAKAAERAQKALDKAITVEDFTRIRSGFQRAIGVENVKLTQKQVARAKRLKDTIDRKQLLFRYRKNVNKADNHLAEGKFDDAQQSYEAAIELFSGTVEAARLVPQAQRDKLRREITTKLAEVRKCRNEAGTAAAIITARESGDRNALEQALLAALKVPTISAKERTGYEKELKDIQVAKRLDLARQHISDGNTTEARAELQKILTIDPEHILAKSLLADIEKADKRATLIKVGNKAFLDRNYSKALELFNKAGQMSMDPDLTDKIKDCKYQISVAKGTAYVQKRQYAKAKAAYDDAEQIKPENAIQLQELRKAMKTQKDYEAALAKGDAAMRNKDWDKALEHFKAAKVIQSTEDVTKRINTTHYQKYLQAGKKAQANGDTAGARWNYRMAQRQIDNAEIRTLLKQVALADKDNEK